MGTLVGIIKDFKTGNITTLMVRFDMAESGQELRRKHPKLVKSFPDCTPIKRQVLYYYHGLLNKFIFTGT